MALPNYSPQGRILFGSVPWDDSYSDVRLYPDLTTQYNDLAERMVLSTTDYVYVGRNRRLKVDIEADRLYRCNYCMYRNDSLTDGYIYCFVSDVQYINDHTSEVTLTTDVFQTYLHSVDWTIPACFIERETVPSEDDYYMYTPEPDFSLTHVVDGQTHDMFELGGFVVATCADPQQNSSIIDDILNPGGYYAKPAQTVARNGIVNGAAYYYTSANNSAPITEGVENILNGLMQAGSIESVVSVFSVPTFAVSGLSDGWLNSPSGQRGPTEWEDSFTIPDRGTTLDGYAPRNRKLLYWPYTFIRLTDHNGSTSDLRYELMGSNDINIRYVMSPACQALAYPALYAGANGWEVGITTQCGAVGSWSNSAFQSWLSQNAGTIALTLAGIAFNGIQGAQTVNAASRDLMSSANAADSRAARNALTQANGLYQHGESMAGRAGTAAASLLASGVDAAHQPTMTRGQSELNLLFGSGVQGVSAYRMACKSEIAQSIDSFFDRFGYAVGRIETPSLSGRPAWNYVRTQGAAPRSANVGPGGAAPFSRGRGTPADALSVIASALDSGVTFWHTTDGFGDYSQSNGVI